jgi:hypothetical protein
LVKAFKAQHPKFPVMHDYEILSVLLTGKLGDANFQKYVPSNASEATKRALWKWFDNNEYRKFKVEKPPDFR